MKQQILSSVFISYLIMALSMIILTSCKSLNYYNYSSLVNTHFVNDSLKIRMDMLGDIVEVDDIYSSLDTLDKLAIKYPKENIIFSGKTVVEPFYQVNIFASDKPIILKKKTDILNVQRVKKVNDQSYLLFLWTTQMKKQENLYTDADHVLKTLRPIDENPYTFMDFFNDMKHENNVLYFDKKLNESHIEIDPFNNFNDFQLLITYYSIVPNSKKYKELREFYQKKRKKIMLDNPHELKSSINNVKSAISDIIEEEKLVIINENHWFPEDRILMYQLIETFKKNGFEYLAVEALDKEKIDQLNERGFPIKSNGFYLRDPYFGMFIREAVNQGFKLLAYDNFTDNREEGQAAFFNEFLQNNPDEKVLVYVGHSHVWEFNDKKQWMAQILKDKYHIDPLTIDQIRYTFDEVSQVALLQSKLIESQPKVDYYLINNLKPELNDVFDNVEEYTYKNKRLKDYLDQDIFVSLYYSEEYIIYKTNAIPLWNNIYKVTENSISIPIIPGEYIIRVEDDSKNKIIEDSIKH